MKKCIKKNLYAAVDVMAFVTLLLLVAFVAKKDKSLFVGACFAGGISCLIAGIQALFGQSKIENRCSEIIYTKSEEGCDAVELEPKMERYDIDGVKSYGVVYKLSDGVHGVMQKDGTFKIKSFTGKFVNSVRGGVVPYAPDNCWVPLMKAPSTDHFEI